MAIIKVKTGGITADAVTDALIADDVVGTEHLTANEVDTTALKGDAVTGAELADDAVNSEHYTDGSIDTAHLADGQVTTAKLATAVFTGATDIGADIADADLFLMDDGAGGTIRKTAASRFKTYIGGGITSAATVRLTTDLSTEGFVTANWEVSDGDGYGALGSPPTESSGVWTFPSTGIWYVSFSGCFKCSSGTEYGVAAIYVTTNNSAYDLASNVQDRIEDNSEQNAGTASIQLDVTNTSNVKVKFNWTGAGSNLTLQGASTQNLTWAHFIRLGDT